jgi:1,4-dihydroxy-2-naphthoyl-CoA hydrolase
MFTYRTQIFLHYTDAAGRLFFGAQFYLMHEALEKMRDSLGIPIKDMLDHPTLTFPLVHAEADYKSVLIAGDRITVDVGIEKIGNTSVAFSYVIKKEDGALAGTGKTISVCVDKKTQSKVPLPKEWRDKFAKALI